MEIKLIVTLPKNKLDAKRFFNALSDKMEQKTGPELHDLFQDTTNGWALSKKPSFSKKLTRHTKEIKMYVWASGNSNIYNLVSAGSPAHPITAVKSPVLRFKPGYRSATTPGVLWSRAASRFGNTISKRIVHHPGFEAREFDKTIADEYEPTFLEDMQEVINEVARSFDD